MVTHWIRSLCREDEERERTGERKFSFFGFFAKEREREKRHLMFMVCQRASTSIRVTLCVSPNTTTLLQLSISPLITMFVDEDDLINSCGEGREGIWRKGTEWTRTSTSKVRDGIIMREDGIYLIVQRRYKLVCKLLESSLTAMTLLPRQLHRRRLLRSFLWTCFIHLRDAYD